jgi:hypothetical protein
MNSKEAYEYVIADLEQDVGWEPEALETTLDILKQRLHIIGEVHPTLFNDTPDPTDDEGIAKWITDSFEAVAKDPDKTHILDELQARFNKFKQDDN